MKFQQVRKEIYKNIYKIRGENVFDKFIEIEIAERLTDCDFQQYQYNKIIELEKYLKVNIQFYRDYCSPSIVAPESRPVNLSNFQIVDRHSIIPRLNDFFDKKLRASWRATSGTSGTPFIFPKDRNASGYMDAVMHQVYGWHGVKVGDRQARLWGGALSVKGQVAQKIKDFLLGRKRLSVFQCTAETYSSFLKSLQQFKPKLFYAYANALYRFALYVEKAGKNGRELGVQVAICTGEMLLQYQREKINEVFGCYVVNEYGSTENGIIGFECEAGGMHIMPTIYLEIENPDQEGFGQILVTELNSRSVPFIRYRIGDIARCVDGKCVCGRTLPLMELGGGRVNDQIICPNGTVVYATIIAYALKEYVHEFRAIQVSIKCLEVQVIPNREWSLRLQQKLELALRKYLGSEMIIKFMVVVKIHPEKSGKLRYFLSKLPK